MTAPTSTKWTKRLANQITGGLSAPSKMPGKAFGIPAKECKTGRKLRKVKGSTCHKCYALKGRYAFQNVQDAQYRRFSLLLEALANKAFADQYVKAFAFLIGDDDEFRWQDSGDLQSHAHLDLIVAICMATPHTQHWLPTREYKLVLDWLKAGNQIPANLNIRLSAHMVDGPVPDWAYDHGLTTSGVTTDHALGNCHAQISGSGNCEDCRACWDKTSQHINYIAH